MGIRLTGMNSNLDTDSIVQALVSSYSTTKNNLVKAQTKLSWKQDALKEMNSKIYSFYSTKLSDLRFSYSYNIKSATISNSAYAKVSASTAAVNGTQKLVVEKLASAGYLTGGVISGTDADGKTTKLTGESKLSEVTGMSAMTDGTINVTVGGKSKAINVKSDMSIDSFISELKDAGVGANFDEKNQRFFVYSATSGKDHDFTLTAGNSAGLAAIQGLGLYTENATDKAEYVKWANYTTDELDALKEAAYESAKKKYEDVAKSYADKYNKAAQVVKDYTKDTSFDTHKTDLALIKDSFNSSYESYAKKDADGNYILDADGNRTYDTDAIEADGKTEAYNTLRQSIANRQSVVDTIQSNMDIMSNCSAYVSLDTDGKAVADESNAKVIEEVDNYNAAARISTAQKIDDKVAMAKEVVNGTSGATPTSTAVRITGEDAVIYLNKAKYESNTNNFSINGLTIQATEVTGADGVSITTNTDVDGIYDMIKGFFTEYNTLIKTIDTAYNAASSKGYEPLIDDEKAAMSDSEVEKWEKKIKDSILRKDETMNSIATSFKTNMLTSFIIDGERYNLSSFGISTSGYFSSGDNEKGVFHIDGDQEDSSTKGKTDKLKAMIANDPDTVVSFFSQLSTKMYSDLTQRMTSTTIRSAYTIYNDKQMSTEYSEYSTKIKNWETKIADMEEAYYKKFTAMETALASLNSKQASLSSLLGSG